MRERTNERINVQTDKNEWMEFKLLGLACLQRRRTAAFTEVYLSKCLSISRSISFRLHSTVFLFFSLSLLILYPPDMMVACNVDSENVPQDFYLINRDLTIWTRIVLFAFLPLPTTLHAMTDRLYFHHSILLFHSNKFFLGGGKKKNWVLFPTQPSPLLAKKKF